MTAYTTNFAGNVQIGTGDNINPPDEGNVLVQQSINVIPSTGNSTSTFFRLPANCRIADAWFDIGPTAATAVGTFALYYAPIDTPASYVNYTGGSIILTAGNRSLIAAPTGANFTVQLNTGVNIFWRFDTANVAPAGASVGQLVIRYHLLTP